MMATNVGNMYTASLYGGLVSYLTSCSKEQMLDKRVGLFSYGSGFVSTFFSLRVNANGLDTLLQSLSDVRGRLDSRRKIAPAEFSSVMQHREDTHHLAPFQPKGEAANLISGTYYVEAIDEMYRRTYAKNTTGSSSTNGKIC